MSTSLRPTRPRESLLELFDPLHDENSPPTQQGSDSDKENSTPTTPASYPGRLMDEDATMSSFFEKKTTDENAEAQHIVLKKRLIDYGDTTITEPSLIMQALPSDEEETELEMAHARHVPSLLDSTFAQEEEVAPAPRTPFRDLLIDSTPKASTGKRSRLTPSYNTTPVIRSPLSSVLNATPSSMATPSRRTPRIMVTPSQADNSFSLVSTLSDLRLGGISTPASVAAEERSRSTPDTSISMADTSLKTRDNLSVPSPACNRMSLDLHASFSFQMSCPESSFDLLKDNISLAGLAEGKDDSFDMEIDLGQGTGPEEVPLPPDTSSIEEEAASTSVMAAEAEESCAPPAVAALDPTTPNVPEPPTPTSTTTSATFTPADLPTTSALKMIKRPRAPAATGSIPTRTTSSGMPRLQPRSSSSSLSCRLGHTISSSISKLPSIAPLSINNKNTTVSAAAPRTSGVPVSRKPVSTGGAVPSSSTSALKPPTRYGSGGFPSTRVGGLENSKPRTLRTGTVSRRAT